MKLKTKLEIVFVATHNNFYLVLNHSNFKHFSPALNQKPKGARGNTVIKISICLISTKTTVQILKPIGFLQIWFQENGRVELQISAPTLNSTH
jgi:hypothetical protein